MFSRLCETSSEFAETMEDSKISNIYFNNLLRIFRLLGTSNLLIVSHHHIIIYFAYLR